MSYDRVSAPSKQRGVGRALERLASSLLGLTLLVLLMPSQSGADSVSCTTSGFSCAGGGYSATAATWTEKYYGWTAAAALGWTGFNGHNCTRYAGFRLAKNGLEDPLSSFGNASQWDERVSAKYGASKVSTSPAVGSIAQWEAASWNYDAGHVAYVERVTSGEITITEDSWGGGTKTRAISRGSSAWPSHFIHLRDLSTPAPAAATSNVAAVSTDGTFFAKQGGLGTSWLTMGGGIASVKISGNNVLALTTSGTLMGKENGFNTNWLTLTTGIKSFDLT